MPSSKQTLTILRSALKRKEGLVGRISRGYRVLAEERTDGLVWFESVLMTNTSSLSDRSSGAKARLVASAVVGVFVPSHERRRNDRHAQLLAGPLGEF